MKPKNLILIAVAVVCGLVAAFLTARMTAGASKPKDVDMVDVPVAARDIPIGTKIPPKDLETFFVMKKFPREAVPPNAVLTLEEIADKRTMRAVRQGESVNVADVNAKSFIDPPDGTVLMSTPISLDQSASGFALPGYKVVVIASKKSQKKNVEIVFPLFVDVLVLAVDTSPSAPQVNGNGGGSGGGNTASSGGSGGQGGATAAGFQQVSMISLAVSPVESELLAMAAQGGASLRLGLPPQDETKKKAVLDGYAELRPTNEKIRKIFADDWGDEKKPEEQKEEVVTAKVPKEPLAWGTQITQEVLDKKFKDVEFPKGLVPESAVTDEKDLLDKYATAELVPSLLVAKPHLSKTEPKKAEPQIIREPKPGEQLVLAGAKAGFNDEAASPKGETDTTKAVVKKEYVYVTITTPQGKRVQKYEVTPKGNVLVDEYAGEAPLEGKDKKDEKKEPRDDKGA